MWWKGQKFGCDGIQVPKLCHQEGLCFIVFWFYFSLCWPYCLADFSLMVARQWWTCPHFHPSKWGSPAEREREKEREHLPPNSSTISWNWLSLGHLGTGAHSGPISGARGVEYDVFPTGVNPSSGQPRVYQSPSWLSDIKEFTEVVINRFT